MAVAIEREFKVMVLKRLAITNNSPPAPATDVEIPYSNLAGGMVYIPNGSSITSLTYWGVSRPTLEPDPSTPGNQPQPTILIYKLVSPNNPQTVAGGAIANGQCYPVPTDLFGAGSIFITANAAGNIEFTGKG